MAQIVPLQETRNPTVLNLSYSCLRLKRSNMASELAKYDLQLPAFSKIGGILANELSVDEAAGRDQAHLLVSLSGYGRTLSLMPPHKLWLPLIIGRAI